MFRNLMSSFTRGCHSLLVEQIIKTAFEIEIICILLFNSANKRVIIVEL